MKQPGNDDHLIELEGPNGRREPLRFSSARAARARFAYERGPVPPFVRPIEHANKFLSI